ncbi:hypothetical protein [Rheinheimera tangshanensis]|uniref:Lipoprotein n=1 Tax=Rheinheimera tangshanensis TaxID=400153 RepID=A0A5C8M2B9_9GAMM|nr:hypothetical protein [Rheinheimera tangshanensis]TXK82048.1 hypothetical protein FU839_03940 [Rheinheimera tangshanensis]GGM51611.1 hypothetical protein GCM10010920_09960 [Rheinheimera tangshanensis]
MIDKSFLRYASLAIFLTLTGCAGQGGLFGVGEFEIIETDNRFNPTGESLIISKNNRISTKSIAGGVHIDSNGVYVNPSVTKSKDGGEISVSLLIVNHTSHDTAFGSPNVLGKPERISFLIDNGKLIELKIFDAEHEWADTRYYNSGTRSVYTQIMESGVAPLTKSQYREIMQAKNLVVKLVGTKRSVTYEASEISQSFQENLSLFYQNNM